MTALFSRLTTVSGGRLRAEERELSLYAHAPHRGAGAPGAAAPCKASACLPYGPPDRRGATITVWDMTVRDHARTRVLRQRRDPRFRRGMARSIVKGLRKSRLAYLTSGLRILPDFIVIGSQRGGTSSLFSYLIQHPAVIAASLKEIHYFDRNYEKGSGWYRSHFPTRAYQALAGFRSGAPPMTGEATPGYIFHPEAPRRVASLVPDVKLVAMLRNPVDRAYSNYCHRVARGLEDLSSFEEAITAEPARLADESTVDGDERYSGSEYRLHSYLARGRYFEQLTRWFGCFPRDRFLIEKSEDFFGNPGFTLTALLDFLGLPDFERPEYKKLNSLSSGSMNPDTRAQLVAYFKPHNERLYELVGRDFGWDA